MGKSISEIKIGFNCKQDWGSMEGKSSNRYCNKCARTVIDFSTLSDDEVINYFRQNINTKTCGKFGSNQLDKINMLFNSSKSSKAKNLIYACILVGFLALSSCKTSNYHNNVDCAYYTPSSYVVINYIYTEDSLNSKTVGVIVNQLGKPIMGTNIYIENTSIRTSTDINGIFELEVPNSMNNEANVIADILEADHLEMKLSEVKNKEIKITLNDYYKLGEVIVK